MSIHCKVYRTTSTYGLTGRRPSVTHAWWTTCEYDWGTVNMLHRSWRHAMEHARREIQSVASRRAAA